MKIVFFDGECLLCQGFIKFLWRHNHNRKLFFAPLQGITAEKLLPETLRKNLKTVVFWDEATIFEKSEAVTAILLELGGIYKFISYLAKLTPKFIRNFFYDIVASNRTKWFGRSNDCLFIGDADQKYFLN
jgi:predicted DCC family thiol-disulfide oxidoreductase YuxK